VNCETFRDAALDWLEGSLGDPAAFRTHRAACPACAALLAGFEENERLLRDARVPAAPADLWPRIAASLAVPSRCVRSGFKRNIAALAAALLLGLAGLVASVAAPRDLEVTIVDVDPAAARTMSAFLPRYEGPDGGLAFGD
jgi:anti-sigma factor RsiW